MSPWALCPGVWAAVPSAVHAAVRRASAQHAHTPVRSLEWVRRSPTSGGSCPPATVAPCSPPPSASSISSVQQEAPGVCSARRCARVTSIVRPRSGTRSRERPLKRSRRLSRAVKSALVTTTGIARRSTHPPPAPHQVSLGGPRTLRRHRPQYRAGPTPPPPSTPPGVARGPRTLPPPPRGPRANALCTARGRRGACRNPAQFPAREKCARVSPARRMAREEEVT